MFQNTKSFKTASLLIILLGFGFLWFGLKPVNHPLPSPTPLVETTPEATSAAVASVESEQVKVTKVIDGDTIEIEGGIKVRLLGIDTPETKDSRRPVGCFGKEAANETKRLLEGSIVILEKDISETDKYRRLLRYVFLPLEDGSPREATPKAGEAGNLLFVNDYLIREGFAKTLTYPPDVKYTQVFLEAQTEAKVNKKGLWGRC